MNRNVYFLLASSLTLSLIFSGCSGNAKSSVTEKIENARAVEVMSLQPQVLSRTMSLQGELQPYESVDLFAKVQGFVDAVYVDRGDSVQKGQLLARLSAPELGSQISQAQAQAQAMTSQISEANARYQSALSTYQRLKGAAQTPGAIADNELDLARNTMEAAKANINTLMGSARSAQANVSSVRNIQSYLQLRAPFSGVVTQRNLHPGALVGPGGSTALLRVEKISLLRLVVAVPEKSLGSIQPGAVVRFTVPAYADKSFFGKVNRLSHSLDTRTRTEPVELSVDNSKNELDPGMYAEIEWADQHKKPIMAVPPSAIVTTTEQTFVVRVRDNKAEWVSVKRGDVFGDMVEVIGPLQTGDQIVTKATDEIRNGMEVSINKDRE